MLRAETVPRLRSPSVSLSSCMSEATHRTADHDTTPRARSRVLRLGFFGCVVVVAIGLVGCAYYGVRYEVTAFDETDPVPSRGDAADDPCIWVSTDEPSRSLFIGTDKKSGLCIFDLEGNLLEHLAVGRVNNVDLREGFPFERGVAPIVAASNKDSDTIDVFALDTAARTLSFVFRITPPKGFLPDGLCLFKNPRNGSFHVIATTKRGGLAQFELSKDGGELVRKIRLSGETEGCVTDDELGALYVSEENVGIWRMRADPAEGDDRILVDTVGRFGRLNNDVEGLAIWHGPAGTGYLVASNQGGDDYLVYERGGDNPFVGRFSIGATETIDSVDHTDGIEITSFPILPHYPRGLMIVQDDLDGESAGSGMERQNFKLISWDAIEHVVVKPF